MAARTRREYITVVTASGTVVTTRRTMTSGKVPDVPSGSSVVGGAQRVEGSVIRTESKGRTFMTASGVLRTLVAPTLAASAPRTKIVVAGTPQMPTAASSVSCLNSDAVSMPPISDVVAVPDAPPADPPISGGVLSAQNRQDLSAFMATSVLPNTNRVYAKEWRAWTIFIKTETGSDDPYLVGVPDDEKAALVALLMMRRHGKGKRGKAASAFTAAVRHMNAQMVMSTTFLESSIIATARSSCLMKPDEVRARKDEGPSSTVKLPICESILSDMRDRLWKGRDWSDESKKSKAAYLACMYGFDTAGRVSEYTHCELGGQDHCARVDDLTFSVEVAGITEYITGSGLAEMRLGDSFEGRRHVTECMVRTVSAKGKVVVKPKHMSRRSPEEEEFLDDLVSWIVHSGTTGKEEVFSFRRSDGQLMPMTGRTVRDELKRTCEHNGLPPAYFSSHSLRKGAITHMRAQGASEDDRRDRGNYSAGSQVMNSTYDYAVGLGPLASNSLKGGHRLDKKDIKRMLPPKRKSE